jgi:hypothetical protein
MTLTALITLNAVLGAGVVYGLVHLLGHGIVSDHRERLRTPVETVTVSRRDGEQLAA